MKRRGRIVLFLALSWLALGSSVLQGSAFTKVHGQQREGTVVLAAPDDPYYTLAEEISSVEGLALYHALDEALASDPEFLLWVAAPAHLSDEALISLASAIQDHALSVSAGIISGGTLERARDLWQRADEVTSERMIVANAANPAGHIEAEIVEIDHAGTTWHPMTRSNLVRSLQQASYLTFTGHGGTSYLRLDPSTALRSAELPVLDAVVVATGSCNTFRPWETNSIALAFVDHGAAAYAGFSYSPNAGFLFGQYDGLPFRYTWPEYPIGHVVQIQNHGALQGFAAFPYYFLLGDPRIFLQTAPPYRLSGSHSSSWVYTLEYEDAPAGVIPVRVPDGAGYPFVRIPGAGIAWRGEPFYNDRVQAIDIGSDKFVLFEHGGGPFQLQLYTRTPWLQVASDVVLDALDGTLLFFQDAGGATIFTLIGILMLIPVAILLLRHKATPGTLATAGGVGLAFAALHAVYGLSRIDMVTITAKEVVFHLLSPVSTFLLVTAGAFFFLGARSRRGRTMGVVVATLPAFVPAVALLALLGVLDNLVMQSKIGTDLWNCHMGMQPLVVFLLGAPLLAGIFHAIKRGARAQAHRTQRRQRRHEAIVGD